MIKDTELPDLLAPDAPLLLDAPERPGRMEADTAAAIGASVVGALCVIFCAVGLIRVYVEPSGPVAVVLAGVATGVVACGLLAGGVWAWLQDRAHRSR